MKAVCWNGITDVSVEEVPDPKLINPRDAIVRVTSTAICGSDLHLYDGDIPTMKKGDILGHEFMGEVVEVGSGVKNLQSATELWSRSRSRVEIVTSARTGCGHCVTIRIRTHRWLKACMGTLRPGFLDIHT